MNGMAGDLAEDGAAGSMQPRIGTRRPDIRARMLMMAARPCLVLSAVYPGRDNEPIDTAEIVRVVDRRPAVLGPEPK